MSETESNDSAATADVLSSGQEIKGQLSSSSDRDVFSITTTSAGTLKIDLDTPTYSTGNYFSVILWTILLQGCLYLSLILFSII